LKQERLNTIQELVFRKVWEGRTYAEIADTAGYDSDYIKRIGSQLWRSLSKTCGEKVTKSNIHSVLRRHWQKIDSEVINSEFRIQNSELRIPHSQNRVDWGEVAEISKFYGRASELAELEQWLCSDRCQLVALLGMGGIGKTALAVKLAKRVQSQFNDVVWRSLRNAPPLKELLTSLIKFLCHEQETNIPETIDGKLLQLIDYLRNSRCLIILDNAESILKGGNRAGYYREGYEEYGQLLRYMSETSHQSCIILTSREKPKKIAILEGKTSPVRSLKVAGLKETEAQKIFQEKELTGTEENCKKLIQLYGGNPLALNIVSNTIRELFNGNVAEFLAEGTPIFGDIYDLLEQQFNRLSPVEKQVMYWLAINQEWISLAELREDMLQSISKRELIEAIEALGRRPLIEKSDNRFTQQPVVMEYVTERLIEQVSAEIAGELENSEFTSSSLLITHALIEAGAKDYIRDSQTRLILDPILNKLRAIFRSDKDIENQLNQVLFKLQTEFSTS
ncbi:MAG: NB-ARC domain-containing protein, partial [Microcystaceae cyanobacterium]